MISNSTREIEAWSRPAPRSASIRARCSFRRYPAEIGNRNSSSCPEAAPRNGNSNPAVPTFRRCRFLADVVQHEPRVLGTVGVGRRHQKLLRPHPSRLDAPPCPHGQGGASERAEGRLRRKSKPVPNGGGHAARRHHLAHAGEHDLDGLEKLLAEHFSREGWKSSKKWCPKVNLVRHADDFIITDNSKELLENEVRPLVKSS